MRRRRRARLRAAELGRSRGGLTSKVHLAVERRCRPLSIILTPGQATDSPSFIPILKKIKVRGRGGGCERTWINSRSQSLCRSHWHQYQQFGGTLTEFLADPSALALPHLGDCGVPPAPGRP
ncbi:hypothetical protein [Streptomyces sp. NPDC056468]|uniref:hypothetical protein n=1 Tax=Streptomyces sp. NPDC056468 TaxID=3345830 RepID=UPI0036A2DA4B